MSNEIHPVNSKGNGDYERRDIGVAEFCISWQVWRSVYCSFTSSRTGFIPIWISGRRPISLQSIRWFPMLPPTRAKSRG